MPLAPKVKLLYVAPVSVAEVVLVYWTVEVEGVKVPPKVNGVPVADRVIVPLPASRVAFAVIFKVPAIVIAGEVPPKVVVTVVEPSPIVRLKSERVPAVPAHEAPLEPMQFAPEAELNIVVVAEEDWVNDWLAATLILPESVLDVLPTVKLFPAIAKVPAVMVRLFFASAATPAVKA